MWGTNYFLFCITFAHQILSTLYIFSKLDYSCVSNVLRKYTLLDLLLFFIDFYLWTLCGQCPSLETRAHAGWDLAYSGIENLFTSPRVLLAYWRLTIWFTCKSTIAQNISAISYSFSISYSILCFVVLKVFAFYWHENIVFPHTKAPHLVEENKTFDYYVGFCLCPYFLPSFYKFCN